jgi:hypothetical protein
MSDNAQADNHAIKELDTSFGTSPTSWLRFAGGR